MVSVAVYHIQAVKTFEDLLNLYKISLIGVLLKGIIRFVQMTILHFRINRSIVNSSKKMIHLKFYQTDSITILGTNILLKCFEPVRPFLLHEFLHLTLIQTTHFSSPVMMRYKMDHFLDVSKANHRHQCYNKNSFPCEAEEPIERT